VAYVTTITGDLGPAGDPEEVQMDRSAGKLLLWSPRILGILVALFIGLFALDALAVGILPFLIHLIPTVALLIVVALAWRWPWVGGVVFVALALLYGVQARGHLDWILIIGSPLLVVGVLFVASWRYLARQRT
jgi:hypothetical protein